jgi:RNA polymerase sigma-70 factor (ECF subfamily)
MELEPTLARLAPALLRLALGLTGDRSESEDLAQEALAALVRHWRQHGPPESPAAFACTVVRRQALRRGLRARRLEPLEALPEGAAPGPLPDETAEGRGEFARALRALGSLEPGDREALLLAAVGGLTTAEGAAVLGLSPSAYKMRVHRARQRLARALENDDGREPAPRDEAV